MTNPRCIRHRDAPQHLGISDKECDDLFVRFVARIDFIIQSPCWVWTGSINQSTKKNCLPYGLVRIKRRRVQAHRAAWMLFKDRIPPKLFVLHQCDNPKCVNPSHLFLGTIYDNNRDMANKGRVRSPTKLSAKQVSEIRDSALTQKDLASKYGVSQPTIHHIRKRKTWLRSCQK